MEILGLTSRDDPRRQHEKISLEGMDVTPVSNLSIKNNIVSIQEFANKVKLERLLVKGEVLE